MYTKVFLHDYATALRHASNYFKQSQFAFEGKRSSLPSLESIESTWAETRGRWLVRDPALSDSLASLYTRIGKIQLPLLSGSYFPGGKKQTKSEWAIKIDGFISFEDFYSKATGLPFTDEIHNMIAFFDYDDAITIEFLPILVFAYLFISIGIWSQLPGKRPQFDLLSSDVKNAEAMCTVRQKHDVDTIFDNVDLDELWVLYAAAANQFFERLRLPSLTMARFKRTVHNGKAPHKQDITHMFYATLLFLGIICEFAQSKLDSKAKCSDTSFEVAASIMVFNNQTGGLLDLYFDRRIIGGDDQGLLYRLYSEELYAQMQEDRYEKKELLSEIIEKFSFLDEGITPKKEKLDHHFLPVAESFYERFSAILSALPEPEKMPTLEAPQSLANYQSCINGVAQMLKGMLPLSEDISTFGIESLFDREAKQLITEWEGFMSDAEDGAQPLLLHHTHNFFVRYRERFHEK